MKFFRKLLIVFILTVFGSANAFSADAWMNDLKTVFENNGAIIYAINMRTFASKDNNNNGVIDFDSEEQSGNFINAIGKLNDIQSKGINTLHLLPITPVGKNHAFGTAGSLYAAAGFNSLNPQLKDPKSSLSLNAQARKFFDEAHKRKIRIIVDLPACGSYDLAQTSPQLFAKDKSGQPLTPLDWSDVRVLDGGSETGINREVYSMYKDFVDMMINLGADGIRADVATSKPAAFWKELIAYSKRKDPQFLWLAEASESWTKPLADGVVFTPYNKLLEAGFDGYYGSFFNLKDYKNGNELINQVITTKNHLKKYPEPKSVIGSFATHDEISPILVNGPPYSEMIVWLSATLPLNSYFVDGFPTGDNYLYLWANKEAKKTFTDNDTYFTHRGKIDIFNFSRQPGGNNKFLEKEFIKGNKTKLSLAPVLVSGNFVPLKSNASPVFAYAISQNGGSFVVIGNLNFKSNIESIVTIPNLQEKNLLIPIKMTTTPQLSAGKIKSKLAPGEIQVLMLPDFEVK